MGGVCSTHVRNEKYVILFGKPEENRPLGRPRRRWNNNITIYLRGKKCEFVYWIVLSQERD
jgi:hypothetical protein